MYINEIDEIKNYRNLSGLKIVFNEKRNFIIGENNLGKTNILELIYLSLGKGKFQKEDFTDLSLPIFMKIKIHYSDDEIGFFGDFFDVDGKNEITLSLLQEDFDSKITFMANESKREIPNSILRKINIFYYMSQRIPSKEIDFTKTKGTGRILNYFVERSLNRKNYSTTDLLDINKINEIITIINLYIGKINKVMDDDIIAFMPTDEQNILASLLKLGDDKEITIDNLGDGIQYSFNIIMNIMDYILDLKNTRTEAKFNELLVFTEEGLKLFPILLILDEPEVHQHPHRQRRIIKKISEFLNNENKEMLSILKELFDIDGLCGQLIVSTHSPNILLDDYHEFIRLYRNHSLGVVCGTLINLSDAKHFRRMEYAMKEAFFSNVVLLTEGESEKGAIPILAKKMKIDFDDFNASLAKLDGAGSVLPVMNVLNEFHIKAFAILDCDQKQNFSGNSNILFTKNIDFEHEIAERMTFDEVIKTMREINSEMINCIIQEIKKYDSKFNAKDYIENPQEYILSEEVKNKALDEIKRKFIEKLGKNKNQISSIIMCNNCQNIPDSYIDFINKVKI